MLLTLPHERGTIEPNQVKSRIQSAPTNDAPTFVMTPKIEFDFNQPDPL